MLEFPLNGKNNAIPRHNPHSHVIIYVLIMACHAMLKHESGRQKPKPLVEVFVGTEARGPCF